MVKEKQIQAIVLNLVVGATSLLKKLALDNIMKLKKTQEAHIFYQQRI